MNFKYLNAIIQCSFLDIGKSLLSFFIPLIESFDKKFKKLPGKAGSISLVDKCNKAIQPIFNEKLIDALCSKC